MIVFNILRHYTLVKYVTVDSVKLMLESSVKCLFGLPSIVEVKVLAVLSWEWKLHSIMKSLNVPLEIEYFLTFLI